MKPVKRLQPEDIAPDLPLVSLDGQVVSLNSVWGNANATLLIFLRHLG